MSLLTLIGVLAAPFLLPAAIAWRTPGHYSNYGAGPWVPLDPWSWRRFFDALFIELLVVAAASAMLLLAYGASMVRVF